MRDAVSRFGKCNWFLKGKVSLRLYRVHPYATARRIPWTSIYNAIKVIEIRGMYVKIIGSFGRTAEEESTETK